MERLWPERGEEAAAIMCTSSSRAMPKQRCGARTPDLLAGAICGAVLFLKIFRRALTCRCRECLKNESGTDSRGRRYHGGRCVVAGSGGGDFRFEGQQPPTARYGYGQQQQYYGQAPTSSEKFGGGQQQQQQQHPSWAQSTLSPSRPTEKRTQRSVAAANAYICVKGHLGPYRVSSSSPMTICVRRPSLCS